MSVPKKLNSLMPDVGGVSRDSEGADAEGHAPAGAQASVTPGVTAAMRKNAAWLFEHGESLASFGGDWLAICRGRPVAAGESPDEAVRKAEAAGHTGEDILLVFAGEDNLIY